MKTSRITRYEGLGRLSRAALLTGTCALIGACGGGSGPGYSKPKVVLLVVIDTTSSGHISHLGYDRLTTPNLDQLAADGVSFKEVVTPASYTVASIPSLLTGRLPDRHGLTWYKQRLSDDEQTIAELLGGAGYESLAAIAVANGGSGYGVDQGFDVFNEIYQGPGSGDTWTGERDGQTVHMATADEFIPVVRERLDRLGPEEQLFLYLHVLEPHGPYDPPLGYKQRLLDERYPGPYEEGERIAIQKRLKRQERLEQPPLEEDVQGVIHLYDTNLLWADENVGAVFDELRQRDLYDSALIVVTADHGESFWQHGLNGHGLQLYEEHIRVPLIVKLPTDRGGPRGVQVEGLTSTLDVLPSLCDWLDIPLPEVELDGHSLSDRVADPEAPSKHEMIVLRAREDADQFGLRLASKKLVVHVTKEDEGQISLDRVELFDLETDPEEKVDLFSEHGEVASRLARQLLATLDKLRRDSTVVTGVLTQSEIELLKAIGYAGIDADIDD